LEPHGSSLLKVLLHITRHEYFDARVDPFNGLSCKEVRRDPSWGNNAIGDLMFDDRTRFHRYFPQLTIEHSRMTECLLFINSGGVNTRLPYIPLPTSLLRVFLRFDRFIISHWPDFFALSREIVLVKSGSHFG
jgi:hypothetical protein